MQAGQRQHRPYQVRLPREAELGVNLLGCPGGKKKQSENDRGLTKAPAPRPPKTPHRY